MRKTPGHGLDEPGPSPRHPGLVSRGVTSRDAVLAEDARFELARGCPQHAFQACALGQLGESSVEEDSQLSGT